MYSLGEYGDMIADKVRMDPYAYALKAIVKQDSVVLDIGTGTGIHALLACKFGARKVYAIEKDDAIHLAKELALENGYADRIEFFQDISTHVTLPEKADVIVSDLRGVLPLYDGHIPAIIDARQRHLAPGGVLIPKRDTIWVSLIEAGDVYTNLTTPWDAPYGMSMKKAEKIVLNDWFEKTSETFNKDSLLMEPQIWAVIDYASIENPDVSGSTLIQSATRDGTAHGLLVWFDGEITEGIRVLNGPTAEKVAEVYGCGFFPLLEPVSIAKGDTIVLRLQAELVKGHYLWRWHTHILAGDDPQATKAKFEQSTDRDNPLESAELHKRILNFKPARNEAGDIDFFILGMMDGRKTVDQIAGQAHRKYPQRFETQREAQLYVNDLAKDFGHDASRLNVLDASEDQKFQLHKSLSGVRK
jgi:protein arginine N-methyltransferase 1